MATKKVVICGLSIGNPQNISFPQVTWYFWEGVGMLLFFKKKKRTYVWYFKPVFKYLNINPSKNKYMPGISHSLRWHYVGETGGGYKKISLISVNQRNPEKEPQGWLQTRGCVGVPAPPSWYLRLPGNLTHSPWDVNRINLQSSRQGLTTPLHLRE